MIADTKLDEDLNILSKEQSDSLERLPTCEELPNAMIHTSSNISPDHDGFTA